MIVEHASKTMLQKWLPKWLDYFGLSLPKEHKHAQVDFKKALTARKRVHSELPKTVEITLGGDENDEEY